MLTREKEINQTNSGDTAATVAQRRKLIDALIASADPYAPPAEDEILRLILSELKGGGTGHARRPGSA